MGNEKEIPEDLLTVLSKSGCFYIRFNSSYDLIYASPTLFQFSGYTEESFQNECQGKISMLIHADDFQKMKASIARQLSMGEYFKYEFRLITKSKAVRWVYIRGTMSIVDKQMVYSAIAYDITESKESYKDLLNAKSDLDSITYQLEGGILKICAEDLKIVYANEGFYRLGGYTKSGYAKKYKNTCNGVIYPEDMPVVKKGIKKILKDQGIFTVEFRIFHNDGSLRWCRCTGNFLTKEKNSTLLLCTIMDIDEIKVYEENLLLEKKKHEILCQLNNEYVWEYDLKNRLLHRNGDFKTSYSQEKELPGGFVEIFHNGIVHKDDVDKFEKFYNELKNSIPSISVDLRMKNNKGRYTWHKLQGVTMYDADGNPTRIIGKTTNIDTAAQKLESLKDEAQRDSLTHLLNRKVTEKKINARLKNKKISESALIVLDIKHCKDMQLEYGQLFTDTVIQETSAIITELFPDSIIGRTGFDIFSIFLPGAKLGDELTDLVKETFRRVTSIETGEKNAKIRCHIGTAISDEAGDTFASLFKRADMALFYAKSQDKDYEFFGKEIENIEKLDIIEANIASSTSSKSTMRKFMWTSEDYSLMSEIMNILTNEDNIPNAVHMIIEKIGIYFHAEQVMIVEYMPKENVSKIIYTYYSKDAPEPIEALHSQPIDMVSGYERLFNSQGIFFTNDLTSIKEHSPYIFEFLRNSNIQSLLNCSFSRGNKFAGFLTMHFYKNKHIWKDEDLNLLRSITDIINYVLIKYNKEHDNVYSRGYDNISGLPSFSSFLIEGNSMLTKIQEKKADKKLALVSMDIRKFQFYNINFGFSVGNKAINHMANRLRNFMEVNEICTRLHSDTFYMLLQYDTQSGLETRISSFLSQSNTYKITLPDSSDFFISCGIYLINEEDKDISELIDKVDYARNTSKQLKEQSNYSIYSNRSENRQDNQIDVREHIKKALINREITVMFQPKYDLISDQICGAEALVRWNGKDGKLVFPDVILPILYQERLMADLDFYVIDEVCRSLAAISSKRKKIYPVSVGLSNAHLHNPHFLEQLMEVVSSYRIPINYIQLEIEERILLEEPETMKDFLAKLKTRGFILILSRYGSVKPSLDTLAKFPVDVVKFDMNYFKKHIEEDRNKILLQKTIEAAHALGQKVSVVGLESQLQKSVLSSIGCDLIQGYLYHKPMLPEAFEKYLCADI